MAFWTKAARPHIRIAPLEHANSRGESEPGFIAFIPEPWGTRILDMHVHRLPQTKLDAFVTIAIEKDKDDGRAPRLTNVRKSFWLKDTPPEKLEEKIEDEVNARFNHHSPLVRAFRTSRLEDLRILSAFRID